MTLWQADTVCNAATWRKPGTLHKERSYSLRLEFADYYFRTACTGFPLGPPEIVDRQVSHWTQVPLRQGISPRRIVNG